MPSTTPVSGYPYPLPTDPIANGADAIKALALGIDGRACHAFNNGSPGIPSSGANVVIGLGAESFDHSTPMHDNATNSSRVYAIETGVYALDACVTFGGVSGGSRTVTVMKNSNGDITLATGTALAMGQQAATSTAALPVNVSRIVKLNAGDYVEMFAKQSSGAAVGASGGEGSTYLSLVRVA